MSQPAPSPPTDEPPPDLFGDNPFVTDTPDATPTTATRAWRNITHALGSDLQRGLHRADAARKRMARGF
jgi:hypothetical protein